MWMLMGVILKNLVVFAFIYENLVSPRKETKSLISEGWLLSELRRVHHPFSSLMHVNRARNQVSHSFLFCSFTEVEISVSSFFCMLWKDVLYSFVCSQHLA